MALSITSLAEASPPRVTIRRLDNPALVLEAQYNPDQLKEKIGATYSKQTVPGLSHQVKQFTNTNDVAMTFRLSFIARSKKDFEGLIAARLFFKTSVRPRGGVNTVGTAGAPRLFLFWPNFFSMTCVLVSADISYERFNSDASPVLMNVDVAVEEIRDTIILADDFFDEQP
jgi:hypothetical protein